MIRNMGSIDRFLRVGAAIAVAVLYVTGVLSGTLAIVLGLLAAIFLVTGLVGTCPLYLLFKFSTRKKD